MKTKIYAAVGSVTLTVMLALTGCTSSNTTDAGSGSSAKPETASPSPSPSASASDIDAAVQKFTKALDDLGIQHTAAVRAAAGASGAKARFDITVDNFEAGINVFPDAEVLAAWGKASDSFGGIYVSSGTAVLSLNSTEGVTSSAAIAPKIAAAVKGEAHGV